MPKMKAIVTYPQAGGRLELGEVDAPEPGPSQALVRVAAVSLNRGEVRMATSPTSRFVPGWDLAGTVEEAAADGSGPKAGARVVGFLSSGAWAELAAVPTQNLAELPNGVSFSQAASLPVAGLTAWYALQRGGNLLARNVLVTGASGGVGLFAVELAQRAGASVVGLTHHSEYERIVLEAGASHAVTGEDASGAERFGPYHLVCDGVGGQVLSSALRLLAQGGVAVTYGSASGQEVTVNTPQLYRTSGALQGLILFSELRKEPASAGLASLANLVAQGRLHPHIAVEAPWNQASEVARRLMERQYPGKAVLVVG